LYAVAPAAREGRGLATHEHRRYGRIEITDLGIEFQPQRPY